VFQSSNNPFSSMVLSSTQEPKLGLINNDKARRLNLHGQLKTARLRLSYVPHRKG
jgi:hypothetical protein